MTGIYLSALEHFIHECTVGVDAKKIPIEGFDENQDRYFLSLSSAGRRLGYAFSNLNTPDWEGDELIPVIPEELMTPEQRRTWREVKEAYLNTFIYDAFV